MILLFKSYKQYSKEHLSHKFLAYISIYFHVMTSMRGSYKVLCKKIYFHYYSLE